MRIVVALLSLSLTACFTMTGDPSAPSAEGTLRLAPNADPTLFHSIEVHWDRVDGTYGESTTEVLDPPFYFPMQFYAGQGFGRSDAHTYRLSVWFSNGTWDMPTTAPPAGAAHASMELAIPKCTDGCPAVRDVELVLAP
jgi:hypothetical protein